MIVDQANVNIGTIHLGASSFDVSLIRGDRSLVYHRRKSLAINSRADQTYDELINEICDGADEIIERGSVAALVITTPVPIDFSRGYVGLAPAMRAMQDRPLRDDVARRLAALDRGQIPVLVENDAKAAALRSLRFFPKPEGADFIHFRVSTGLGGGILVNGRLYRGSRFLAGEVGHITLQPFGAKCGCGNKGCAETVVGGAALLKAISRIPGHRRFHHFEEAIKQAENRDASVVAELEVMGMYLGLVIASTVNLLNPSAVTLSGPMFDKSGILFTKAQEEFSRRVCSGLECAVYLDECGDAAHAESGLAIYLEESQ